MKPIQLKAARNRLWAALITTFFALVITQDFVIPIAPLKELEHKLIDFRFEERGEIDFKDSAKVIILEITQEAYDQIPSPYNSWPWPRKYFAKIIENLNEAGVKAIGVDLIMSNPDKFSEENDRELMEAISKYRNVVVAGKIDIDAEAAFEGRGDRSIIRSIEDNFSNIFFGVDSSIGIVQAVSDNDGVYRRYVPYIYSAVKNKKIPSFAYAVLNKYFGNESFYTAVKSDGHFLYNNTFLPEYEESTVLVNYYGADGKFPRVKFIDVLDDSEFLTVDEIDFETEINTWDNPDYGLKYSGLFKDKIVLIGSTMPEDKDIIPVSFSPGQRKGDNLLYGVEYHANAIQNFLEQNFLYSLSRSHEIIIVIVLTLVLFFITSFIKRIKSKKAFLIELTIVISILLTLFIIFRLSVHFFESDNLILPVIDPMLAIIFGYVGSTVYEFFVERQQSTMMKNMFSQYVSGNLVNELIANPDKLRLGGEKKNLTVLFSDIAGFTSFSEGKTAEEVVSFINEFLDEMTESVLTFNGTLDKYLGDSVMAFWGAPVEFEDHAILACRSALDMKERLELLNKRWNQGEASTKMRIGINTGEVVVGNIGGQKRFDYTVMGDNVNLASRLEGVNKIYGTSIILSEVTYKIIKDYFVTRKLDTIRVKGKSKATDVYELLSDVQSNIDWDFENFDQGLLEYQKGNFEKAILYFESQFKLNNDAVSELYLKRCNELIKNVPADWDGIYNITEK